MLIHLRRVPLILMGSIFLTWLILDTGCIGPVDVDAIAKNCQGLSIAQIKKLNSISDECRQAIQSSLSGYSSNASNRVIALGSFTDAASGERKLLLHGLDSAGQELTDVHWARAKVSAVSDSGVVTQLSSDDFIVKSLRDSSESLLSISVVSDYSASMRDVDLDQVGEIYQDLFTYLPAIFEAQLMQFSTQFSQRLDFTSDRAAVLAGVSRDPSYKRESTALYDGIGAALEGLAKRERPIKILVVSTDGLENSSIHYKRAQLKARILDEKIFVVMIGALFADVGELKEIEGERGLYFYAQSYDIAKSKMQQYIRSLQALVQLSVQNLPAGTRTIRVELPGISTIEVK